MTERSPAEGIEEGVEQTPSGTSLLRRFVRLLLVVVVGIAIGVAGYLGARAGLRLATEPVAVNSAAIEDLRAELQSLRTEMLQSERRGRANLDQVQQDLAEQADEIAGLQNEIEQQQLQSARLDELQAAIELTAAQVQALTEAVEAVQASQTETVAEAEQDIRSMAEIERQLQLIRIMELVARARFELVRGNLGLAEENLQAALSAVDALTPSTASGDNETLVGLEARLQLAQNSLAQSPQVAADDLEAGWRLLVELTAAGGQTDE